MTKFDNLKLQQLKLILQEKIGIKNIFFSFFFKSIYPQKDRKLHSLTKSPIRPTDKVNPISFFVFGELLLVPTFFVVGLYNSRKGPPYPANLSFSLVPPTLLPLPLRCTPNPPSPSLSLCAASFPFLFPACTPLYHGSVIIVSLQSYLYNFVCLAIKPPLQLHLHRTLLLLK